MTARVGLLAALIGATFALTARAADDDEGTRARKIGLELAGAFSNDGFKMRDGHWIGMVKPNERILVAVNLYAGNQYWFCAGASDKIRKINVELFDEGGRPLAAETFNDEGKAAAGYSPTNSGQYYVSLAVQEGAALTCALMYSYK